MESGLCSWSSFANGDSTTTFYLIAIRWTVVGLLSLAPLEAEPCPSRVGSISVSFVHTPPGPTYLTFLAAVTGGMTGPGLMLASYLCPVLPAMT